MSKKWYSYFVVSDAPTGDASAAPAPPPDLPPRRVSDLTDDLLTDDLPVRADPPVDTAAPPADLSMVYASAKIAAPPHGYTILKIAEMLQSEHLRDLPSDVRRRSVLAALDAAGVKVDEVVQDAVRRDHALDTYERVLQQHVDQLTAASTTENLQLEEEVARRVAELRSQIDDNNRRVAAERAEFEAWRTHKQQEEALIAETVAHFVSENPITTARGDESHRGDANVR